MCVVSNSMAFDPTRKGDHCADISSPLSGTSARYMFGALKVLAVEWEWPKIVLGCLFCLSFFEYEGLVVPNDFITSYNPGYNKGDIKFGRIYQNK